MEDMEAVHTLKNMRSPSPNKRSDFTETEDEDGVEELDRAGCVKFTPNQP